MIAVLVREGRAGQQIQHSERHDTMRNNLKKAAALVLAVVMCLSFAGCYSENKTWAAKQGDDVLPIGSYIYYLNSAYSEAMEKVDTETDVLSTTVEGESAESWIRARALEYVNSYYFINNKFEELGLEYTDEDASTAEYNSDYMWTYYRTTMEEIGIAKESFHKAYAEYNAKYQKVLNAIYGEGGEKEISQEEMKAHFMENYLPYEYFYVPLTTTDEEGNSVNMTDAQKNETMDKLNDLAKRVEDGKITLEEAAGEYAEETGGSAENSNYYDYSSIKAEDISSENIRTALQQAKENEVLVLDNAENANGCYVVRKHVAEEKFTALLENETQKDSLILDMKGDEFRDYVKEQAASVQGVEINQSAINSYKLKKIVNDSNKKGSSEAESSAAPEEGSSEASSDSSAEGSSESSAETE